MTEANLILFSYNHLITNKIIYLNYKYYFNLCQQYIKLKNKGTMFEKSIVSYFTLHIYEAFGGGIFLCGKPAPEKYRVRQQFWLE